MVYTVNDKWVTERHRTALPKPYKLLVLFRYGIWEENQYRIYSEYVYGCSSEWTHLVIVFHGFSEGQGLSLYINAVLTNRLDTKRRVQGVLCPGGLCPGGLCPGILCQGDPRTETLHMVTRGRCVPY